MKKKRALAVQLVLSVTIIVSTLIAVLFYENIYAMKAMRVQVSKSTDRLLMPQVGAIDQSLDQIVFFLLRSITSTTDMGYLDLLSLSLYPDSSSDYFFAKQRIIKKFKDNLPVYPKVKAFFAYDVPAGDLIYSLPNEKDENLIPDMLKAYLLDTGNMIVQRWHLIADKSGNSYLLRVEKATDGGDVLIGSLVGVQSLIDPLKSLEGGEKWQTVLLSENGQPLTETALSSSDLLPFDNAAPSPGRRDDPFTTAELDGKRHLIVKLTFQRAPMVLLLAIPERELLRPLLFFQRGLYFIPLIGIVVLAFSVLSLRQVLIRPIKELIVGMRRIGKGDFQVRLKEEKTRELAFVNETFNNMVEQIQGLKINVYEEKLQKQKAELRHLQAQINPHFYLNSLNIIHSLSLLGRNRLVEKMAQHLSDYFRYITRAHRESIPLGDEMNHIVNYLEIQKLRFPRKLTYEVRMPDRLREIQVLPLLAQPFVENAIIHGMEKGRRGIHIEITVSEESATANGLLAIRIQDNGKGFPADKLESFARKEFAQGPKGNHLGIWNVYHRLKIKYGNEAEIAFVNAEPGAVVMLAVPIRIEEE